MESIILPILSVATVITLYRVVNNNNINNCEKKCDEQIPIMRCPTEACIGNQKRAICKQACRL